MTSLSRRLLTIGLVAAAAGALLGGVVAAQQPPPPPPPPPPPADSGQMFEAFRQKLETFTSARIRLSVDDPPWLGRPLEASARVFGPLQDAQDDLARPHRISPHARVITARGDGTVYYDTAQGGGDRYWFDGQGLARVYWDHPPQGAPFRTAESQPWADTTVQFLWSEVRSGFEGRPLAYVSPEQDGVPSPLLRAPVRWARVAEAVPGIDGVVYVYFGFAGAGQLEHVVLRHGPDRKWFRVNEPMWNAIPNTFWQPLARPLPLASPMP